MARASTTGSEALAPAPASRFRLPARASGLLDEADRAFALDVVRALIDPPTAPYAEDAQVAYVRRFAAERPGFELAEDAHANLVVTWRGADAGRARRGPRVAGDIPVLAFSAHLDHPGFHYAGRRGRAHRATFHGGVPERFFPGAPVRFFAPGTTDALATAVVERVAREGDELVATLRRFRGAAREGMFGVFDLASACFRGRRLHARVCDDLLGAAAILCALDRLARDSHPRPVVGIFTRAEETGFVGCQGLLRAGAGARNGALAPLVAGGLAVVGLECSPRRPTARVGGGPVIRVGDRQSVFDPELTHHLQEAAASLAAREPAFRFQRALMDGGSCESTAYNLWGVRAGALCLALGNYHNCGPKGAIAPEYVDWDDLEGLVRLLCEAASTWREGDPGARMRARLERIWTRERGRLSSSARRLRAKNPRGADDGRDELGRR